MSLKKPKDIPKISRPREKKIDKIKDHTPHKKKSEIEFNCNIYFKTKTASDVQYYCIEVETVQYFSFLSYELSLQFKKKKNVVYISIIGLKAKNNYVNEPSPAVTELLFEDLYGKYTINILKQDGSINSAVFDINVFKKEIIILETFLPEKENNRQFCSFNVQQNKFSFINKGIR